MLNQQNWLSTINITNINIGTENKTYLRNSPYELVSSKLRVDEYHFTTVGGSLSRVFWSITVYGTWKLQRCTSQYSTSNKCGKYKSSIHCVHTKWAPYTVCNNNCKPALSKFFLQRQNIYSKYLNWVKSMHYCQAQHNFRVWRFVQIRLITFKCSDVQALHFFEITFWNFWPTTPFLRLSTTNRR